MYGSDGNTLVLSIANDDGSPGDGSIEDPVRIQMVCNFNGLKLLHGDLRMIL